MPLQRTISLAAVGVIPNLHKLSDQGSTGSLAQARVHDEVRRELIRADAQALAATLRRDLVTPLVRFNLGPEGLAVLPRLSFDVAEREDLSALAEQLERLVKLGLEVPQAWARAKWGVPERSGNEPLLAAAPAAPGQLAGMAAGGHAGGQAGAAPGPAVRTLHATQFRPAPVAAPPPVDAIDALVDEAMGHWREQLAPVLAPLERLFARAEAEQWSAAELIEALAPTLARPDEAALTEALARAAYTARLAGVHGLEDAQEPEGEADAAGGAAGGADRAR